MRIIKFGVPSKFGDLFVSSTNLGTSVDGHEKIQRENFIEFAQEIICRANIVQNLYCSECTGNILTFFLYLLLANTLKMSLVGKLN
jgi:hypothetical protein